MVEGSNGTVKIASSNAGKEFAAEEISAQVLRKLVDDASKFLNDKVCIPGAPSRSYAYPPEHSFCTSVPWSWRPVITGSLGVRGRDT